VINLGIMWTCHKIAHVVVPFLLTHVSLEYNINNNEILAFYESLVNIFDLTWTYPVIILFYILNIVLVGRLCTSLVEFKTPSISVDNSNCNNNNHSYKNNSNNNNNNINNNSNNNSNKSYKHRDNGIEGGFEKIADNIAFCIHHGIVIILTYAQCWVIYYLPYVGKPFYWISVSLLMSFYCEDSALKVMQKRPHVRRRIFESLWAYFIGFGALPMIASLTLEHISATVVASIYVPIGIVNIIGGMMHTNFIFDENSLDSTTVLAQKQSSFPFFFIPLHLSEWASNNFISFLTK